MPFLLLCGFLLILIVSGWGFLYWRYRSRLAAIIVTTAAALGSILTCSIASTFIPEAHNEDLPQKVSNEDLGIDVFHEDWQLINSIGESPIELEYRSTEGIFVKTQDEEIRIGGVLPSCTRESFETRADVAPDLFARVITNEQCPTCNDILSPPTRPKEQLTLEIVFPKWSEMFGAISYAIYDNGEVWCSERHVHLGMPNLALAAASAFDFIGIVIVTIGAFIISFVGGIIVTIVIFEIQRRKEQKQKT